MPWRPSSPITGSSLPPRMGQQEAKLDKQVRFRTPWTSVTESSMGTGSGRVAGRGVGLQRKGIPLAGLLALGVLLVGFGRYAAGADDFERPPINYSSAPASNAV